MEDKGIEEGWRLEGTEITVAHPLITGVTFIELLMCKMAQAVIFCFGIAV